MEVADALDLDELEAAKLVSAILESPEANFQPHVYASVTLFHERRLLIARTLFLILQQASNTELDEEFRELLTVEVVAQILDIKNGPPANGSQFARKCLGSMEGIEVWLQRLQDQSQKASVLGQTQSAELLRLIEIQRSMLVQQHEALGGCLSYLFLRDYTISEDLRKVLEVARKRERLDILLVHYLPALISAFFQYGSLEGAGSLQAARSLHQLIVRSEIGQNDDPRRPFKAILTLLWLGYYSSWYREPSNANELRGVDLEQESQERSRLIQGSLDDGALEALLAVCALIAADEWRDPARQELVHHLLGASSIITQEEDESSGDFQNLFMERLENFAECWITNMPDTIRHLKSMEDDERLRLISSEQSALELDGQLDEGEAKLHLECFLVLISYAFEHRPEASDAFWADADSNLYGFLQWSSKRQTVPRVSAFCEMLISISDGFEASSAAHRFLLEESQLTNKYRRSPSLNYSQMFAELELYSNKVHEGPKVQSSQGLKFGGASLNEAESPVMLACYLRLIAHMCNQCSAARELIFSHKTINLVSILLKLSYGPVPAYLRASVFKTLQALLTETSAHNQKEMWIFLDQWSSGEAPASVNAAGAVYNSKQRGRAISMYLERLASNLDEGNAYIALLQTLIAPATDADDAFLSSLPFPENLGSTYRAPGIEPYVDFVVRDYFTKRFHEAQEESPQLIYRFNCLNFIATCLETLDEKAILSIAKPRKRQNLASDSSAALTYIQRHPFSRIMELLHDVDAFKMLLSCTKAPLDLVLRSSSDSVLIATLQRSIDILNLALDLQPDYDDVVWPVLKSTSGGERSVSHFSATLSFEEALINFSSYLGDLRLYAATNHPELAKRSLSLLSRLTRSRKLNQQRLTQGARRQLRKPIDILDPQTTSEESTIAFISKLQVDVFELEQGPQSAGYSIKESIVSFFNSCLENYVESPSIAHTMLGFSIAGNSLVIEPHGLIDNGVSPLHSLMNLVCDYPDGETGSFEFWMLHLKRASFQVLKSLWSSPVSAALTLAEMRKARFLFSALSQQHAINNGALWHGVPHGATELWLGEAADTLAEFLRFRSLLCEYALSELISASQEGLTAVTAGAVSRLLGDAAGSSGQSITNITLFDLFDIADFDVHSPFDMPDAVFLHDLSLDRCRYLSEEISQPLYDPLLVQEALGNSVTSLRLGDRNQTAIDLDRAGREADSLYEHILASNRLSVAIAYRRQAIRSWVELVIAVLSLYPGEGSSRAQFALQSLQLILTKLENFIVEAMEEAIDLMRLADELTNALNDVSPTKSQGRISSMINERMQQLFQICVTGASTPNSSSRLRELMYSVCTRYLLRTNGSGADLARLRHSSFDSVKSAGARFTATLYSDTDTAEDACKLAASLFLNTLVALGQTERSQYILQSFIQSNFLDALIEPIKTIASDVQEAQPNGK